MMARQVNMPTESGGEVPSTGGGRHWISHTMPQVGGTAAGMMRPSVPKSAVTSLAGEYDGCASSARETDLERTSARRGLAETHRARA